MEIVWQTSKEKGDFWKLFTLEVASWPVGVGVPRRCDIVNQGVLIRFSTNCGTFQWTSQRHLGENSEAAEVLCEQVEESLG